MSSRAFILFLWFFITILIVIVIGSTARAELIQDERIYINETITIESPFEIGDTGRVTFVGCRILVNESITVLSGGRLTISDSTIECFEDNTGMGFLLKASRKSTIEINHSSFFPLFNDIQDSLNMEIIIETSKALVNGSTFNSTFSLVFQDVTGAICSNATFNNRHGISIIGCTDIVVSHCSFRSSVYEKHLFRYFRGVSIHDSKNITIEDSRFSHYADYHIGAWNSTKISLRSLTISSGRVSYQYGRGIIMVDVDVVTITGSVIEGFSWTGINVTDSSTFTMKGCDINGNALGLLLDNCSDASVTTSIFNRNGLAVYVREGAGTSIYTNDFMFNGQDVQDLGTTSWDIGGYGNYWMDYKGRDDDIDGIGDTPHPIPPGSQDDHPLMLPYNLEPFGVIDSDPSDSEENVTLTHPITLILSSPVDPGQLAAAIQATPSTTLDLRSTSGDLYGYYVIFSNEANWSENTDYKVTVSADLQDVFGRRLGSDFSFVFTTRIESAPEITLVSPVNGSFVRPGEPIHVRIDSYGLDRVWVDTGFSNDTYNSTDVQIETIAWTDGDVCVRVEAHDVGGRSSVETYCFVIDGTPPTLVETSPTNGSHIQNGTVIEIAYAEANLVSINVTIGGLKQVFTSSTFNLEAVDWPRGPVPIELFAMDMAGNTDRKRLEFTFDPDPPNIRLVSPAEMSVVNSIQLIVVEALDDSMAQILVSIGGLGWSEAEPDGAGLVTITVPELADGPFSLNVLSSDKAGNSKREVFWFVFDGTPPHISVSIPPSGGFITKRGSVTVRVVEDNLVEISTMVDTEVVFKGFSFEISIDGANLAEGAHAIVVHATDRAGNRAVETVNFEVDDTPPLIVLSNRRSGGFYSVSDVLELEIIERNLESAIVTLDKEPHSTYRDLEFTIELNRTHHGWHDVDITAIDYAGNRGNLSFSIFIDDKVPIVSFLDLVDGDEISPGYIVRISIQDDSPFTARIRFNEDEWQTLGPDLTFRVPLTAEEGDGLIEVMAVDEVGNSYQVELDVTIVPKDEEPSDGNVYLIVLGLILIVASIGSILIIKARGGPRR